MYCDQPATSCSCHHSGLNTLELSQNKPFVPCYFCWAFCQSNKKSNWYGPMLSDFSLQGWEGVVLVCLLTSLQPCHFLIRRKYRHCHLSHFCTWGLFHTCGSVTTVAVGGETTQALFYVHSSVQVTIGVGSFLQHICVKRTFSLTVPLLCHSCNSENPAGL